MPGIVGIEPSSTLAVHFSLELTTSPGPEAGTEEAKQEPAPTQVQEAGPRSGRELVRYWNRVVAGACQHLVQHSL